ncbi:Outer membrane efflux protein [Stieleria maiorica]|uniref:Outer membrane efflux protein n=1 Tax=Stieleria maiorica TaxID=2795974 RepID=A0A5B9MBV3_9BACT|nr:TolC family protein [Stieleria maiorica]QEF97025.1 Outer membrane efflux protein [Stieleria maiorica]
MGRTVCNFFIAIATCFSVAGSVGAQTRDLPSWLTESTVPSAAEDAPAPELTEVYAEPVPEIPMAAALQLADQSDEHPDAAPSQATPPSYVAMNPDPLVVGDVPKEWLNETTISTSAGPTQVTSASVKQFLRSMAQRSPISDTYRPWWEATATAPFELSASSVVVDGDSLILEALRHSFRIAAVNENICIARTGITRAAADFDPTAFVESKFVRTSVPTGSDLDAGTNVDRLREEDFSFSGGLRRKTQTGAEFEIGQQIGLRDSSSQFFTPDNQGNSRLTLSFNQPLLNGAGQAYNQSLIVLAKLDTQIANEAATTTIQDHLLRVQESMWNLYYQRASLLLRIRHLNQAKSIHDWLENRQDLDALQSQLKRAEAAIATRNSELARAVTAIRNAEDQLRMLVNSPRLSDDKTVEIIPARPPSLTLVPVSMEDAVVTALQQRSEMNEVARELDTARVRLNVACNELLPMLDLVLETYVSGLRGSQDIGGSWIDQFSVGEPSYSAGLLFEVPLQRRAAKANVIRRQAELRKLAGRLGETIAKLHAEVAAAVREVETSHRELGARYVAMVSAQEYVDLISNRWRELPGDGFSANSLLEDLLDAQDRLLLEEVGFARAQIDYTLSTSRLKRATGTLLQIQPVGAAN